MTVALSPIPCTIYSSVLCWSKYAQLKISQLIMILHKNAFNTGLTAFNALWILYKGGGYPNTMRYYNSFVHKKMRHMTLTKFELQPLQLLLTSIYRSWIHTNNSSIFSPLSSMRSFVFEIKTQNCICERVIKHAEKTLPLLAWIQL